jgi:hypothetical protein
VSRRAADLLPKAPPAVLRRRVVGALLLGSLWLPAGCDSAAPDRSPSLQRSGRFGSLRDLVLFATADPIDGDVLFVDRFEVTRGDWSEFAASPAGRAVGATRAVVGGDPSLPIGGVDLSQARAFASWRFLRLPRREEWLVAAATDGRSRFPWGGREDPLKTNTSELGLGGPTPVGTFESGRRSGGDQPYDLVGNVSEWTESVAPLWWRQTSDVVSGPVRMRRDLLRTPALAVFALPGGVFPPTWLVAAGAGAVPRIVVGSDFQTPMDQQVQQVPAGDLRARTGLRVCSSARELLAALLAFDEPLDGRDDVQVRRFVRRGRHREALLAAWRVGPPAVDGTSPAGGAATPMLRLLQQELFGAELPR